MAAHIAVMEGEVRAAETAEKVVDMLRAWYCSGNAFPVSTSVCTGRLSGSVRFPYLLPLLR